VINLEEQAKRRMFIGSKGQPSAVLRTRKGEGEEAGKKRLTESGWNMDAPHTFTENEDTTGVFRVTDPKPPRKRKRKANKSEDSVTSESSEDIQIEAGVPGNPAPPLGWLNPVSGKGDPIAVSIQEGKEDDEVIAAAKKKHGKKYEWVAGAKKPEPKEDDSDKSDDKAEEKSEAKSDDS